MSQPFDIALPPDLFFSDGYKIRVTALDPVTGDTVTGVNVNNVTFQVEILSGEGTTLEYGPFMFVPGPGA